MTRDDAPRGRRESQRLGHVDRLAINREARRPPHPDVGPRGALRPLLGKHEEEEPVGPNPGEREAGSTPDVLGDRAVEEIRAVHLAPLERGRASGLLGQAPHDHPLDARRLTPVALEGLEDELDARLEADELVRARPDGRTAELILADLFDVLLGHDPRRARGARSVERHEVGPRLGQVEAHAARIDHLHLADPRLEERRRRAAVAPERKLHILGRDRITVVESRSLAQHEFPDATVLRHAPRLGERGRVESARHWLHQRVVQRVHDHERRDLGVGFRGVEPARRQGDVHPPRDRPAGLGADRRDTGQEQREEGRRHHDLSPMAHELSFLFRTVRGFYTARLDT